MHGIWITRPTVRAGEAKLVANKEEILSAKQLKQKDLFSNNSNNVPKAHTVRDQVIMLLSSNSKSQVVAHKLPLDAPLAHTPRQVDLVLVLSNRLLCHQVKRRLMRSFSRSFVINLPPEVPVELPRLAELSKFLMMTTQASSITKNVEKPAKICEWAWTTLSASV